MEQRLILFFIFLFSYWSSWAQVYNVTGYSANQDLHSQVISIFQDREGFLWFGTHGGVNRFDGKSFQHFGDDEGLPGSFLRDIVDVSSGMLWMTTDNGLSRFDGQTFTNFTTEDSLPANDLTCLMEEEGEGNLWIGTQANGLCVYDGQRFLPNPYQWEGNSTDHAVRTFLQDKTGRIWIGTLEGLFTKDADDVIHFAGIQGIPERAEIYCLLEDSRGNIWMGTNQGLFRYKDGRAEEMVMVAKNLPDTEVHCITEDSEGQLWMGTRRGIIRYTDETFYPLESRDRFLDYEMADACVDSEGNIWFGTIGGGARKITVGVFESYSMQNRLSSNLAKSFLEDEQGNIWIVTRDRGINVWDINQKQVRDYFTSEDALGGDAICSGFEDRSGNFWFASYNGTLTKYNGSAFRVFGRKEGLLCNAAYVVRQDNNGRLWVGTDNGIFILQDDKVIEHIQVKDGLSSNIIYSLLEDHLGRIWIGTADRISRWDDGKVLIFDSKDMVGENVFALVEDSDHRIWVGSSMGLTMIEQEEAQWLKISGAEGADIVVALILENNDFLWIGTENGAYRLRLASYDKSLPKNEFDHFTTKDGLPSLECNAQAAFQDSRGNIWLGTSEGVVVSPANTPKDIQTQKPPIYIMKVVGAQDGSWESLGYSLDAHRLPQNLVLAHSENRLEFEYIAISLKSPKQIEYKYILEGLAGYDDWDKQNSVRDTRILFPNLPAGQYTFKVTAKREAESWDFENYASFSFKVLPPFWASWWFLSTLALILIAVGLGVYQIVMTRRKERQIRNRADMLQLEHQALYAMMNPHFTFNALQSIQYFIHRQDKKAANKFLSSFAKLIRKNLESTKVDFISLGEEIERLRLYLSLEKMRFPEKFDYDVKVGPGVELSETQIPPMLLQPFVENSIKHGIMALDQDGMIHVEVNPYNEEYLSITIEDNGIGIEASKARKKDRPSDHVSKGMQITLDRLALFAKMTGKEYSLNIGEIKSPEGEVRGTVVKMILPVKTDQTILVVD